MDDFEDEEENQIKELEKIFWKNTDNIIEVKPETINKLKSITDESVTRNIVQRMLKTNKDLNLNLTENFPEFKSDTYGERQYS